jgi:hypothetical protein
MSVSYGSANNFGPCFPAVTGGTSGIPNTSAEPTAPAPQEGTPLNTDNPVTSRSEMATQAYFQTGALG